MIYRVNDLTAYAQDKEIVYRFYSKIAFCEHGRSCKVCCWLYTASKGSTGYGQFHICPLSQKPRRALHAIASRFMYTIRYGHTDSLVLHSCDVRLCCNYHHLFVGSYKANTQDMHRKGRANTSKGEKHWKAKITREVIPHMKALREYGLTYDAIGSIVGISGRQAWSILNGKYWKHLNQ